MSRLYAVQVQATVYVVAESGNDAERIACSQTEQEWLEGWAFRGCLKPAAIDDAWRNVEPLRDYGDRGDGRTCAQIAEEPL